MRIIGGKLKGRNFYRPAGVRLTQNVTRKAIFDIIGQELKGQMVLDLFSGSGAIGLEALSRGAKMATFVEKEPKNAQVIQKNLSLLELENYEIFNRDSFASVKLLAKEKRTFDLIFCDPPYGKGLAKKALNLLARYDILQPNCFILIQHEKREILPETEGRILLFKQKKYGATVVSIYQKDNG